MTPRPPRPIGPLTHAEQAAVDAGLCMLAPYGCDGQRVTRWWCGAHWSRWKRHGDAGDPVVPRRLRTLTGFVSSSSGRCTLPFCDEPHHALGLCGGHYSRLMRDGTPGTTPVVKHAKWTPTEAPSAAVAVALELAGGNLDRLRWNPRTQAVEVLPPRKQKTTGRPVGRPPALDAAAVQRARDMVDGGVSTAEAARRLGVAPETLRRYLRGWQPARHR